MAETVKITDGTTSVDLINVNGLDVMTWRHGAIENRATRLSSPFSDGDSLQFISRGNAIEELECTLKGTSNDNVAAQLQTLFGLLEDAYKYHTTDWQTVPVYIQAQTKNETNVRYALIYSAEVIPGDTWLDPLFSGGNVWQNIALKIEREPYWRSTAPGTLPASALSIGHDDSSITDTKIFVPNHQSGATITHIYRRIPSAAASAGNEYSANLVNASNFELFPSPADKETQLYIGSTQGPFFNVVFLLSNLRPDHNAASGMRWEKPATGGSDLQWASFATTEDGTNAFRGTNNASGNATLKVYPGTTGWAASTVNGVAASWLRAALISGTNTTIPTQASRTVYTARKPWLNIGASAPVNGDVNALLRMYLDNANPTNNLTVGVGGFLAGLKTRGLANFSSRLGWAGNNPTGWTTTYNSADSSSSINGSAGSLLLTCTFASFKTLVKRATLSNTTTNVVNDFTGTYRAILRLGQIAGNASDVSVQLRAVCNGLGDADAQTGMFWKSDTKYLSRVNPAQDTVEVVDMGIVNVPILPRTRPLVATPASAMTQLDFTLYASANGSTATTATCLNIYDLALIPIDEWVYAAEVPNMLNSGDDTMTVQKTNALVFDGGLIGRGTQLVTSGTNPNTVGLQWYQMSPSPELPSDRAGEIHFFFYDQGMPVKSSPAQGLQLTLHTHDRWHQLRGAD